MKRVFDFCARIGWCGAPLMIVGLTLSGCGAGKTDPSGEYAVETYLEQKAERAQPLPYPDANEPSSDSLLVNLKEQFHDPIWDRQPFESAEDWLGRMRRVIELNDDALMLTEEELADVKQKKAWYVAKINELLNQNETMKKILMDPDALQGDENFIQATYELPFTIHLVQKDENLFKIAMKYYGTSQMVDEIVTWNQGWIRNPDDLVAGVGLVLFLPTAKDKNARVVENYLRRIQSNRR